MSAEPASVRETTLVHNLHRRATSLLADVATRSTIPVESVVELRDFLVAALHHHHESEDDILWPMIEKIAPEAAAPLADLGEEHGALDKALNRLSAVVAHEPGGREALESAAVDVRDLLHRHLDHEEQILLPALRAHITDEAWTRFSQQVIATAPPDGAHLMFGFLDQVGAPEDVDLIIDNLPDPLREAVPALRQQGHAALSTLQST
jgi:hemerythrin-like domain-containing protein